MSLRPWAWHTLFAPHQGYGTPLTQQPVGVARPYHAKPLTFASGCLDLLVIFMEPFAEVSCILKVDVHCDACKMKLVDVLSSVCGVYALTINAEKGEVNVCGEVNPNLLVKALKETGKHAEIVHVKLKHPSLTTPTSRYLPYNGYGYGHGHGHGPGHGYCYGHGYGYDYGHGYGQTMPMSSYNYSMRRPLMMEQPHYYGHVSSHPR
ncbi:putative RNA exonuclease 4-like [Capsicum annuum]|nr:putative RNA exonuclease 4-like [Capsicum annuum]